MQPELKRWDVWYADFPFEEDDGRSKDRPVVILSVRPIVALTVKITSQDKRENDPFDIALKYPDTVGLEKDSVVRVSKISELTHNMFRRKVGTLHPQDAMLVQQTFVKYQEFLKSITPPSEDDGAASKTNVFS